jgi:hypothetical protein
MAVRDSNQEGDLQLALNNIKRTQNLAIRVDSGIPCSVKGAEGEHAGDWKRHREPTLEKCFWRRGTGHLSDDRSRLDF